MSETLRDKLASAPDPAAFEHALAILETLKQHKKFCHVNLAVFTRLVDTRIDEVYRHCASALESGHIRDIERLANLRDLKPLIKGGHYTSPLDPIICSKLAGLSNLAHGDLDLDSLDALNRLEAIKNKFPFSRSNTENIPVVGKINAAMKHKFEQFLKTAGSSVPASSNPDISPLGTQPILGIEDSNEDAKSTSSTQDNSTKAAKYQNQIKALQDQVVELQVERNQLAHQLDETMTFPSNVGQVSNDQSLFGNQRSGLDPPPYQPSLFGQRPNPPSLFGDQGPSAGNRGNDGSIPNNTLLSSSIFSSQPNRPSLFGGPTASGPSNTGNNIFSSPSLFSSPSNPPSSWDGPTAKAPSNNTSRHPFG